MPWPFADKISPPPPSRPTRKNSEESYVDLQPSLSFLLARDDDPRCCPGFCSRRDHSPEPALRRTLSALGGNQRSLHRSVTPAVVRQSALRFRGLGLLLLPYCNRCVDRGMGPTGRAQLRRHHRRANIAENPGGRRTEPRVAPVALLTRELHRSEEHTSELQSPCNLVCRL